MIVMSHRGYWKAPHEKNTAAAFRRSFDLGFGTETDVRDHAGELVISHDPPLGPEMPFSVFLELVGDRDLPLALNVKADGLAKAVRVAMGRTRLTKWFVFDMSVPDTLQHLAVGNPVYLRQSEYEPEPLLIERAAGVWLDAFASDWWTARTVAGWVDRGKSVCVVSPELHGRDHLPAWGTLKGSDFADAGDVYLCTDHPERAADYFGGVQ